MIKLEKGQSRENCLTQVNSNLVSRLLTESSCLKNKVLADYNIHDFLPSETQLPDYNITIKTHQQIEKHPVSDNSDPISVSSANQNNQLVARIIETTQQMNKYKQQNENLKKQIEQLNQQQSQIINKDKDNEKQLEKCKNIIIDLQAEIKQVNSQKEILEGQIKKLSEEINKKKANIRIFCQKYEVTVQPNIKHSYTVEVQTATDEYNQYPDIVPPRNRRIASLPTGQQLIHEHQSLKKPKSMFYEIYQQKVGNPNIDNVDLHNQPTTRSQVMVSGQKIRKPKFLENDSNFKHEGNLRHRESKKQILDRIDGGKENKMGLSNIRKQTQHRYKVREEQLEIYPIEEDNVEQIVQGLLASFK